MNSCRIGQVKLDHDSMSTSAKPRFLNFAPLQKQHLTTLKGLIVLFLDGLPILTHKLRSPGSSKSKILKYLKAYVCSCGLPRKNQWDVCLLEEFASPSTKCNVSFKVNSPSPPILTDYR
ncbi:uncharacterized protein PHALS_03109 [Plasmopara halstedii]|uniref:Uncharacterized protein n=1 Tax=Plasmopara halstedii TaxID=4781 RepID=A0A0P1A7B7_PLAHL|nr:uncharacterized protein PHALS_03109 [Plasmopara halstedii]CEG36561.1 hypothetical protein PHALS_03109 [Plasmopara halstedii]|eukprot:XP_024572930.1 hypothetical protein PHALS_03109 [Plasmopara halstedii]